jgi:hypothetical protein
MVEEIILFSGERMTLNVDSKFCVVLLSDCVHFFDSFSNSYAHCYKHEAILYNFVGRKTFYALW